MSILKKVNVDAHDLVIEGRTKLLVSDYKDSDALTFVSDYAAVAQRSGVAAFGLVDTELDIGKLFPAQGCHDNMSHIGLGKGKGTDFISSCWLPSNSSERFKERHRRWCEFIFNEKISPWRPILKNIKIIESPHTGNPHAWHISDPNLGDLPKLAVHNLCITGRQSYEKAWAVNTWNLFVEEGFTELEAFFFLIHLRQDDPKQTVLTTYQCPGHWSFYGTSGPLKYNTLVKGLDLENCEPKNKLNSSMSYYGNTAIWYDKDDLAKMCKVNGYNYTHPYYADGSMKFFPHKFWREIFKAQTRKPIIGKFFSGVGKSIDKTTNRGSEIIKKIQIKDFITLAREHAELYQNDSKTRDAFVFQA